MLIFVSDSYLTYLVHRWSFSSLCHISTTAKVYFLFGNRWFSETPETPWNQTIRQRRKRMEFRAPGKFKPATLSNSHICHKSRLKFWYSSSFQVAWQHKNPHGTTNYCRCRYDNISMVIEGNGSSTIYGVDSLFIKLMKEKCLFRI